MLEIHMGLLFGHTNVNLFVRPRESPIGHKAKLCDPSFHSDFKLEELQEYLDRIKGKTGQMAVGSQIYR